MKIPVPPPSYRAAFPWNKVKPGAPATFRSPKDAWWPPFPGPNNPGRRSRKAADCSAGSMRRRPIGRRKLSAPATDANRSAVRPSSVSALIAPPSTNRMLKKSASGVLASLRGSTYRSVRLASSLAVALLDGLFEHPEAILPSEPYGQFQLYCRHQPSFSASR